tara:strand:+ start:662 stop:1021 length:360 start_codon:yes stop_codon:yes gene_type:complete
MANKSTTFQKYDRNRYRKIYPITRYPASTSYRSRAEVIVESATVVFDKEFEKTGTLKGRYDTIPTITLGVSTTDEIGEESNVNIFISSLTLTADKLVIFTIQASDSFTGEVVLQVISII